MFGWFKENEDYRIVETESDEFVVQEFIDAFGCCFYSDVKRCSSLSEAKTHIGKLREKDKANKIRKVHAA